MITSRNSLSLILVLLVFFSCSSLKTFTTNTQPEYSFTQEQLLDIQYFISSPVTLQLQEKKRKSKITKDNEVNSKKVYYREDLIIDEETPGIAEILQGNKITVKFSDDIALGFTPDTAAAKGVYKLTTFNNQYITDKSEVSYKSKTWVIRFGKPGSKFLGLFYDENKFEEKGRPSLLYNLKSDYEKEYKTVVLKGKELK
jgi:hypothetical protein